MNYERWISTRYLTAKKDRFLSVINFVATAGVAIGVMALIVVIGVMTGFDVDLREKIVGTLAHVVIEKETGVKDFRTLESEVRNIPGVQGVTPYIQGNIFLEDSGRAVGLALRGIDPAREAEVSKIKEYLKAGAVEDLTKDGVIIGSQLASYFGYSLGDEITVITPASGVAGGGWRHTLQVVGVFTSGMYDYDMNLIITHLTKAQEIYNLSPDTVSGLALRLTNINDAEAIKERLYAQFGYSYLVKTWIDSNRNFFAALKLEKLAMFIILTLIVLVASFNIISTLIVTVTTKVKDIGILKAIGVPKAAIRRIFTIQGVSIGLIGTFWGLVMGLGLSWVLQRYQLIKLPQDIYYIDHLPIITQLSDVLLIVGAALLISYLATIYPAAKAAQMEPVDALRYE